MYSYVWVNALNTNGARRKLSCERVGAPVIYYQQHAPEMAYVPRLNETNEPDVKQTVIHVCNKLFLDVSPHIVSNVFCCTSLRLSIIPGKTYIKLNTFLIYPILNPRCIIFIKTFSDIHALMSIYSFIFYKRFKNISLNRCRLWTDFHPMRGGCNDKV